MMEADWRQKLWNGGYEVKFYGAYNDESDASLATETGAAASKSQGNFELNKAWHIGWNAIIESDDTFRRFYTIDSIYATSARFHALSNRRG